MSMNFLKKIFGLEKRMVEPFAGGWQGSVSGEFLYGNTLVTPDNAEALSTVFACVSAISSTISALPVYVYRLEGKARREVSDGPIPALIKRGPNPHQSMPEFLEMLTAQILLRGNGLVEIGTETLCVIPWHWCNVQMLPSGQLVYDVYDQFGIYAPSQGKRRRLLQGAVIHIRDRSEDGLVGRSRLQRCASVIRGAQTVHDFATAAFRNGFYPSGIISSDGKLGPEQRVQLNNAFTRGFAGAKNAARAFILDQGLQWHSLNAISPEDAELLASRKFTTEELCRVFQVPPPIIQDYSHNTFTNSEQAGRWFAQFCLLPWVRKIEAAFNRALFPSGEFELALDMSGFDRGDPATRWQAHAIAASNGILDVDEIREIEGWGPREAQTQENSE